MNVQIKNDEAVSPVIGVILMVAITVILAATIAIFVFGETDKLDSTQKFVALQGSATGSQVEVDISGGSDIAELEKLQFEFKNKGGDNHPAYVIANRIWLKSGDSDGYDNEGVVLPSAKNGTEDGGTPAFSNNAFDIGDTFKMPNLGGDFEVTGYFADGTEQILYSKSFVDKSDEP